MIFFLIRVAVFSGLVIACVALVAAAVVVCVRSFEWVRDAIEEVF